MHSAGDGVGDACTPTVTADNTNVTVDEGETAVNTGTVSDANGGTAVTTFDLTVDNVAPTIDSITVPLAPVAISNQPVSASASFSDPAGSSDDQYTCTVDYDDGSGPQVGTVSGISCVGPNHQRQPGPQRYS